MSTGQTSSSLAATAGSRATASSTSTPMKSASVLTWLAPRGLPPRALMETPGLRPAVNGRAGARPLGHLLAHQVGDLRDLLGDNDPGLGEARDLLGRGVLPALHDRAGVAE